MTATTPTRARASVATLTSIPAFFLLLAAIVGVWFGGAIRAAEPGSQAAKSIKQAEEIFEAAGVRGGLIVHVGCGGGELTAALGAADGVLVHGLDTDPEAVATARTRIDADGRYGKVAVDTFDGTRLPYVDNLVNLLVVDAPGELPRAEMLRVVAPGGVACMRQNGLWQPIAKPRTEAIDEWTHFLHDASGNAVADDRVVGPPKRVQWVGSPEYLRHHDHMSGLSAMVSARGRLFYVMDLGPRWAVEMLPKWTLVARDGFSGVVLWQRAIEKWHAHLWPLKKGPADLMRRLVAEGDTVYVTLGVGEPVSALDATTGCTNRIYEGTEGTEEMVLADGLLFALVNPELDAYQTLSRSSVEATRQSGRTWNWDEKPRRLVAVEPGSGKVVWSRSSRVAPVSLAAGSGRVYFHDGERVVCLEARTGEEVWASDPLPRWKPMHVLFGPSLVVHDDVVLFAGGEKMDPFRGGKDTMTALAAETGKTLWTAPHPPSGYASSEDLFVIDGLVWCGDTSNPRNSGVMTGRDLHTGEVVREFPPDDWQPHMPHHRCHRAKATCNYILTSRTGIEMVDIREQTWTSHHWVRGSCNYGIMPANGLLYAPPHSCACYLLAKLSGFHALAPATSEPRPGASEANSTARLRVGPAYARAGGRSSSEKQAKKRDEGAADGAGASWPTYRGDAARSGSTTTAVTPAAMTSCWETEVGGRLSAPVVAGGKVFVAAIDRHTVFALDEVTGAKQWSFTTGGRVDSPPTVWHDHVFFGSADGYVYSLRARDGALAWRFQAAPADHRLTSHEQVESVWPVHGSVLVREGVVYCVAGRSMWLDGGLRFLRLNARTGKLLSETVLDDKYPDTDDNLQEGIRWPNLPVALPDVLSCDGRHVYMRSQPFDLEGRRTEVITPRRYDEQKGPTSHLFSPTGFLDDSWWHRTYWMLGRSYISAAGGWHLAPYQAPAGRILAVENGENGSVYGFGRIPFQVRGTPNAYHLFACPREPELINPNPDRPPLRRGSSVFGKVVPTRLNYDWSEAVPLLVRAIVATDTALFVGGPPVQADEAEVYVAYGEAEVRKKMTEHVAAFEGEKGGLLMAVAKADGAKLAAYRLDSPPVFDGLIAAGGRLFLSTLDGKVLALGPGGGRPLVEAPEAEPGPAPTGSSFLETKSHPDFEKLISIRITPAELGYRMQSDSREGSYALEKLDTPLSKRVTLRAKIRPRPGAPAGTPGNAFLALGNDPTDERLVKCGFRISGQRLYVVQGPLVAGRSKSVPVDVVANVVTELEVVVDLERQTIQATMNGQTVEAALEKPLEAVTWVGCCVASIDAEFGPVEVGGE